MGKLYSTCYSTAIFAGLFVRCSIPTDPVGERRERARERERLSHRVRSREALNPPMPTGPRTFHHPVGAASGMKTIGHIGQGQGGTQERVVLDPGRARWIIPKRRGSDGMVPGSEATCGKRSAQASGIVTRRAETRRPSGADAVAPGVSVRRPERLESGPQGTHEKAKGLSHAKNTKPGRLAKNRHVRTETPLGRTRRVSHIVCLATRRRPFPILVTRDFVRRWHRGLPGGVSCFQPGLGLVVEVPKPRPVLRQKPSQPFRGKQLNHLRGNRVERLELSPILWVRACAV